MTELMSSNTYFCVCLTLLAFLAGRTLQRKTNLAVLNPILIGAGIVMVVLCLLDISNETYQAGCRVLSYLLTPATIGLAISFYEQFQALKKHLAAVCIGVLAGTICSLVSILLLCRVFGLDRALTIALLPKSITTAIGTPLSEELGGIAAVTTAAIAITGIFGYTVGPLLCKVLRLTDPIAQGVAFGTSSHVIGTAKATDLSQLAGAVGSLSLTIAGILSCVLLSLVSQWIQ